MEPSDGAFDDPAVDAKAGAVRDAAAGDHRFDALGPDEAAVLVVVVAPVGQQHVRPASWSADQARYGRDLRKQRQQLRHIVAVSAGQRHSEWDALPFAGLPPYSTSEKPSICTHDGR